jgi:heme-degrading monooxygenase HmoA
MTMFVAMNRFQIVPGREDEFERIWHERESHLSVVPGFVQFALLRAEDGEFISHSTWEDRAAFEAWTQSDQFARGHRQGRSLEGIVGGPPQLRTYEAVLVEAPSGPVSGH